jgi:hypothetical protein
MVSSISSLSRSATLSALRITAIRTLRESLVQGSKWPPLAGPAVILAQNLSSNGEP